MELASGLLPSDPLPQTEHVKLNVAPRALCMPIVCTCGTSLPDDARFCYRCGKPQREEFRDFEPDTPLASSPPPVPESALPLAMTFNNPLALRISLLVASVSTLLEVLPLVALVAPILGGFLSASLYQRRSGQVLTPGAGAKLGWITAVLNALMLTIFLSILFLLGGSAGFNTLRESFLRQQTSSLAREQAMQLLNDPHMLAVIVLIVWIICFVIASLLYMAGGALGARMYRQKTL